MAEGEPISMYSEEDIQELKDKYSQEMRDDEQNPIKICMRLIYQAATERDIAKRAEISMELSSFLSKSPGIINLCLAVVDFDPSSQKVTTHNQRFLAIANIISFLPKLSMPYIDYCRSISIQLKSLLVSNNVNYSSLASVIMKSLFDSPHAHGKNIDEAILNVILEGLKSPEKNPNQLISYNLCESISVIHNLVQNHFPSKKFINIFPQLFYCYTTVVNTPSHLKRQLETCLIKILRDLNAGPAVCLLEETVLFQNDLMEIYTTSVEDEGILIDFSSKAHRKLDSSPNLLNESFEDVRSTAIHLLNCLEDDLLVMEYFFHFQTKIWSTSSAEHRWKCASLIDWLLEDAAEEINEKKLAPKIDLNQIILSNIERALKLIWKTLMNYAEFLRSTDGDTLPDAQKLINQSLNSCLTILDILSSNFKLEQTHTSKRILSVLRDIKSIKADWKKGEALKFEQDIESLIDKFSTFGGSQNGETGDEAKFSNEMKMLMKDLNDPLVPVRVHALVKIKQLVQANDNQILSQIPKIFTLVESTLADEESYVFLSSINLIAEMCLRKTQDILPRLMDLYTRPDLSIQQKLNTGEVLVKLFKRLNKTTPHYAGQIIHTLIKNTCQEDEDLLKISSLTNIGELCRYLGNSLGKYILDVLGCVELHMRSCHSLEVKCASVELLRTALMGVDNSTLENIQREMKSIYKLLKEVRYRTLDDSLILLVDLALDEIDRIAKQMFGVSKLDTRAAPEELSKNLRFLSLH